MVKGVSRRIVVVESPDERFEEAIFIVRNDAHSEGVSAAALVQEARKIAKNCANKNAAGSAAQKISPQLGAALGAGAVGIAWILVTLFA